MVSLQFQNISLQTGSCQNYLYTITLCTSSPWLARSSMWNFLLDTGVVHQITQCSLFVYEFIFIWGATSELVQLIKWNHVLTKRKPTVTSFPNMKFVVLDYHPVLHLTHATVTRLASYWTARLRYLLLTVFSFKSVSVHDPSYNQLFLNVFWAFKTYDVWLWTNRNWCEKP
jgi:hypothetical protein